MSSESTVKPYRVDFKSDVGDAESASEAAWRATYVAALRVIDHHRTNLEARMTIQRLRRDERRPLDDSTRPSVVG